MLDDMLSHLETIHTKPVWQPIPDVVRTSLREPLPVDETSLATVHRQFLQDVLPYTCHNTHPGFMGWVQGGGTPVGMLADMLAAGLNANLGGRDQMPVAVENQVGTWVRELFGYPDTSSGLFVTGTSMANLMSVWIARASARGPAVRTKGVGCSKGLRLVGYTSEAAHGCLTRAFDLAGLGASALRKIPVGSNFQMDIPALRREIAKDRLNGFTPFFVAGTAGTVDVGAIDDLEAIATIAKRECLWFHIDGAYGALGMMSKRLAIRLRGLEASDSVAFDFHKWGQVPYDAGFLIVRDGVQHQATFAAPAAYLRRESRALAAGSPWPCDFGPDLSRGFRALKTWFTLKVYGIAKLAEIIEQTCSLASYMADRISQMPELELLAPVALSIVCFRYRGRNDIFASPISSALNDLNANIVADLQEQGAVAPSATTIQGRIAIRAAIFNHRTTVADVDVLLDQVIAAGDRRTLEWKRCA